MASADFSRRSWKPLVKYNEFVVTLNVSKITAMFQELKSKLNFIGQNKKPVESCTRAKSLLTAMSLQNDAEAIWSVATVNIILSEALHHEAHPHHHHCAPWDHHIVPQWAGGQSGRFRGPLLTMITIIIVPLMPSSSNGCWPKWIFAF